MSRMVEGEWVSEWEPTDEESDEFVREESVFRDELPERPIQGGRYHIFASRTCPWAHRTLLTRSLKQLDTFVGVHFCNEMTDRSWRFTEAEPLYGAEYLYEIYLRADPNYSGRVTVPVLWDSEEETIVNNESSEIIRMLDRVPSDQPRLCPEDLEDAIDHIGDRMYDKLNNGVYRAGFASSQQAYDEAVDGVFEMLDELEELLQTRKWLVGDRMSEADIRLFVTAFRFDAAYYPIFKCNKKRLAEYPNIQAHTVRMLENDDVRKTCDLRAAKRGYASIEAVNPHGLVPVGPPIEFPGFDRWIQ